MYVSMYLRLGRAMETGTEQQGPMHGPSRGGGGGGGDEQCFTEDGHVGLGGSRNRTRGAGCGGGGGAATPIGAAMGQVHVMDAAAGGG